MTKMHRATLWAVFFFSVFFIALPHQAYSQQLEKATLRLNWVISGVHVPFVVAKDKGFYKEEGIDLSIFEGQGSGTAVKLVAAGQDTFGLGIYGAMLNAIAKEAEVKGIFSIGQRSEEAIITLVESGIKEPKDLKGKSIAAAPGSASSALLPVFLKAVGLSEADVKVIQLAGEAGRMALIRKQIDADVAFVTDAVPQLEHAGVKVNIMDWADYGLNLPGVGVFASNKTIKEKPELIKRFLKATAKGWGYTALNMDESLDIVKKAYPQIKEKEVLRRQLIYAIDRIATPNTKGKPIGWHSPKDYEASLELLFKYAGLGKKLTFEECVTNEFIPDSKPWVLTFRPSL